MTKTEMMPARHRAGTRLLAMLAVGVLAGVAAAGLGNRWSLAAIVGWAAACVTYIAWAGLVNARMDAAATSAHATTEDPTRPVTDLLVLLASLASLGAIAVLLVDTHSVSNSTRASLGGLAVASVALSWMLIHTLFTLRYAVLYYRGEVGGINFNQSVPPSYGDFAYFAFTLGMTYQVSDTNITAHPIRMAALRHALLSYLFGSVILATVVNLVAGLYR